MERLGSRMTVRGHGRISLSSAMPLAERLAALSEEVASLIDAHQPHVAALEALFHGVNPKSLIVLAQARGAILAALCRGGLAIHEYSPAEIKSAITGNGRADKQQVAKMVGLLLGLRGRRPSTDATDALAVAICFGQRARLDALGRQRHRARGRRGSAGGEMPSARDRRGAKKP
ncbi:MAG: crossover junction endodeoxyribonuclease RuvC [Thermoanaerobaculia bacterium]|nr:crossover junction endodeoxyribonuclease RuvC [Thermoanaerobaculia bacterium]